MNKRIGTSLTIFLVMVLMISACGKYEEGPAFSIIPKKNRVANIWKIEKVFINDVDRTSLFQDYISAFKLELTNDEKATRTMTTSLGTVTEEGTWEFESSAEKIKLIFSGSTTIHKILKLKSNEMWLEITEAGQKYVYHYVSF